MLFKKKYVNEEQLKEYKMYRAININGISEQPLLSWKYYIHHTEQEIKQAEAVEAERLRNKIQEL